MDTLAVATRFGYLTYETGNTHRVLSSTNQAAYVGGIFDDDMILHYAITDYILITKETK